MGQRTAIIVKLDYQNERIPMDNYSEVAVFYHQWGIGRIILSQMMNVLNGVLSVSTYEKGAVESLCPAGCMNFTQSFRKDVPKLLENVSFDPVKIGKIVRCLDNNNGAVYIHITDVMDKNINHTKTIKYAFMLGSEENGDYKHFCSKETYIKKVGRKYVDDDFLKMFNSVLEYWGAEDMAKDSFSAGQNIKQQYEEYTRQHLFEPLYAEVTIKFKDNGETTDVYVKLNNEAVEGEDDHIFFYYKSVDDLISATSEDPDINGEDFIILPDSVSFFEKL